MASPIRPPLSRGQSATSLPPRQTDGAPEDTTRASAAPIVPQPTPSTWGEAAGASTPSSDRFPAGIDASPPRFFALQPPLLSGYIKASMPYDTYHQAVGLRVIHLLAADAQSTHILMSESQKQGTFGKVKFGYDAIHERVALKEMRLVAARSADALSKFGHPKTLPMSAEDVLLEAERTGIVRSVIDSHIAASIAVNGGEDPLGSLRSQVTSYRVREVIDTGPKMYMVTTAESGDLAELTMIVTPTERAAFALSAAAQIFFEVSAMHAVGFVHLDIKKDNTVFTEHGQTKVIDFGHTCSRVEGEAHIGLRGPHGTHPAPEMLLTDDDLDEDGNWQSVLLTEAVDVWLTALTSLQLLDPLHDRDNPLLYQYNADNHINYVATSTRLAHFEVWRREALDAAGHVKPQVLLEDNEFSRYFARLHRINPSLVDLLLSHALVARVDLRATAKQMSQKTMALVREMTPEQQVPARRVFERGHHALGQPDVYAALDRYQDWLVSQTER